MSLATMIPRIIPAFIVDKLQFRDWVNRWLNAIPYAALGALIFPGIMSVHPDKPYAGLIGGAVAIALAAIGLNVILVVIGAIAAVFLLSV
jgi:branched-subunit amino acid transport protein